MAGLGIVKRQKTQITTDELIRRFPAKKATITDEVVDMINAANNDPEFNGDEFIENMMTYQNIMYNNSGSMVEYINALKFCAYLESDVNNYTEAYKRARANDEFVIARANANTGSTEYKELTAAASRYRKTPMVRDILTQAEMPLYLMFQGARYSAVAKLVDEMDSAAFSKDRINAAKAILEHVKPPENMKIELDVGVKQDSIIDRYENMINDLVAHQQEAIANGGDLHEVTNISIINSAEDEAIDLELVEDIEKDGV
jgi:hypothetical protein